MKSAICLPSVLFLLLAVTLGASDSAPVQGDIAHLDSFAPGEHRAPDVTDVHLLDAEDKRARGFLGKRARGFLGKRARGFLGKRARGFLGKRARGFLGKRARGFLGKRARGFLGKRARGFLGKRARGFLGKRARGFLGKRQVDDDEHADHHLLDDVADLSHQHGGSDAEDWLDDYE